MGKSKYKVVGIVAKPHAMHLSTVLSQIYTVLRAYNCDVLVDRESAKFLNGKAQPAQRGEIVDRSEMVIVLGGDGTMLSLAQYQKGEPRPVLGINMGSLGFLTEVAVTEAVEMTEAALQGKMSHSTRMMLKTELIREGKAKTLQNVLNDVVINKSALARIFNVDVVIDGEKATTIRADGIILSTPTGSTAYNLAAIGPIVHPEMHVILLTPICPHTLTYRPLVLHENTTLELSLLDSEETYLTLDGQRGFPLLQGDIVRVSQSDIRMTIFTPPRRSFFSVLRNKLKWGNH